MPILLAEILNFQGLTHFNGVGSLSYISKISMEIYLAHMVCFRILEKLEIGRAHV